MAELDTLTYRVVTVEHAEGEHVSAPRRVVKLSNLHVRGNRPRGVFMTSHEIELLIEDPERFAAFTPGALVDVAISIRPHETT